VGSKYENRRKKIAIKMRKMGLSIPKIAKELKISKGTASLWLKNVQLLPQQLDAIKSRGMQKAIEGVRAAK